MGHYLPPPIAKESRSPLTKNEFSPVHLKHCHQNKKTPLNFNSYLTTVAPHGGRGSGGAPCSEDAAWRGRFLLCHRTSHWALGGGKGRPRISYIKKKWHQITVNNNNGSKKWVLNTKYCPEASLYMISASFLSNSVTFKTFNLPHQDHP